MKFLVTGSAGLIGARTASLLLEDHHTVVAVDNLNDYYDVKLQTYRLKQLVNQVEKDQCYFDPTSLTDSSPGEYDGPEYLDAEPLVFHRLDVKNRHEKERDLMRSIEV
jgi:nucleoside-diphosphate-sugar epimerase